MRNNRAATLSGSKIKSLAALTRIILNLKKSGQKVVFTNGCFDILHYGHVKYLKDSHALGDILIVGVNSDKSVRSIKGPKRPITQESDRLQVIAALECVDFAVLFNETTSLKLIKKFKPDIIVKGSDWSKENIVGGDFVESYGGKVARVNLVKGRSTSKLIEKIIKVTQGVIPAKAGI